MHAEKQHSGAQGAPLIARVKTVVANPEEFEEGRRFFDDVVAPCCRATEGFIGGWFLQDEAGGRTVTFTLWTRESAWIEARRLLGARLDREPDTAERLERINARGVTFEGFLVASAT